MKQPPRTKDLDACKIAIRQLVESLAPEYVSAWFEANNFQNNVSEGEGDDLRELGRAHVLQDDQGTVHALKRAVFKAGLAEVVAHGSIGADLRHLYGNLRWEKCWRRLLKNMDDVLMGAPSLEALEEMITEFLLSCQDKNIKLKPSMFVISTCVEFGGCRISADRLRDKGFIFITPKEGRVRAFSELKHPSTKREAQVWAGMVSSL